MALKDHLTPALALFVMAPVVGELFSGSSPPLEFFNPLVFLLLAGMYGSGAILCRELTIRWKKGWPSLLVLGMAYGIAEEALACKSFFDPGWMDIGVLGSFGRLWGVNWIWALGLTVYHAVFSIGVSVLLVTFMFPGREREPWVSGRALWYFLGAFAFVEVFCFLLLTPYRPPVLQYFAALAVAALFVAAARFLPDGKGIASRLPSFISGREGRRLGRNWFLQFGIAWTFGLFFFLWAGPFLGLTAAGLGVVTLAFLALSALALARMSGWGRAWTARQQLSLVSGSLGFFVFLGIVLEIGGIRGMSAVAVSEVILLYWLHRNVGASCPNPPDEVSGPRPAGAAPGR